MKKANAVVTGVAALAVAASIGACSSSATKEEAGAKEAATSSAETSASAQAAPHNRADMMFAEMMIPHHEQAIEMSGIILDKKDIDPRVVSLAEQIKAAQGPEIDQMRGWLDQWDMKMEDMPGHGGMGDMPGHGGMGDMSGHGGTGSMPGMAGMLSAAEMDALKAAQGVEASRLFLSGMIKHHEGAITMGQDEIKNGQFPDAVALAKSIVESQQKEIDTMKQILSSL